MASEPDSLAEGPVRILLAEDDLTNQYVFRAILTNAGYEVEIVGNGLLAAERAKQIRPRLLLLDMMMPVMDGYEAASLMSSDPAYDFLPIVALTAKAMKGDLERTLSAGCDDYLSKPVGRQLLLDKIQQWVAKPESEWLPLRRARRASRAA